LYLKKILLITLVLFLFQPVETDAQFQLVGNATTTSSECSAAVTTYALTTNTGNEGGEIWNATQVNLNQRFDIQFQMFLGTKAYSAGADGICFAFQQQSTSAGSVGGGLGYGGITPSVAVEFDTYQNGWDPAFCHTAIEKNGDVNHTDGSGNNLAGPVQLDPANPNLPDGNWHNIEISWDPISKTISVYYDCSLRVTYTGDIINDPTIFNGNPNVYWGFTAGTGGAENRQEVCVTYSLLNDLRDTLVCAGSPVTLTSTGGTSYSWAPPAGLNTTAGASVIATPNITTTYTVSITNSCGIITKDSAVIRVSNTALTPSSTTATCGNPNGTASVTAAGGIIPYTFSWTGGQTTTTATALASGTYTVTSKDSLGCMATATTVVAGTPPLRDSIVSFTNVSVACGANGTALAGVKGGGGTYTYSWNSTPVQTNAQATNLGAGNYTVTVTDNNLCNATATVAIAQPGALTASIASTTNASCNGVGANNGSATASVTGGNGPYTYSWNNGETGIKDTLLTAGSYTVSVTDANGCTVKAVATITQPGALRDSIVKTTNVLCFGQSNGTAVDGVKGGTSPYSYAWNTAPAQTTSTATALATGTYTVVVTDAGGCKDSTTAIIKQPNALELTASPFAATCNGACNGSATVLPSGGTGVYTYLWSNATSATTANVTGLCAGTYSVVVTDENGCIHDTTNLVVTQPPALVLTKTAPVAAFCNQADGSDNVTIAGGTPPYVYAWSNGQTSTSLTGVKPGSYCFGVQDANKCQDSICVIIPNTPGVVANIVSTTSVTCNGGTNGSITGGTTGGTGPFTYSWSTVPAQTSITATTLGAGTYTFTVTDGGTGCQSTATTTVTQPALVVATPGPAQTICISKSANITVTAVGGTAPYTYTWAPGGMTGSPATPAPSPTVTTTYTITTADVNSCPGATVTVVVNVDPALSVTTGTPVAICPGGTTTVTATAKGGNGNYNYTWLPGNTTGQTATVSPATTGYYTVIASDGCTAPDAVDSMEVIVDPLPVIAFSADTTNGCYPVCVTFTDHSTIASGGLKSWDWSFGDGNSSVQDTPKHCYTIPGAYTVSVTVTSDSGCHSSLTQNNMITVYDHPHTNFSDSPQPTDITSPTINFTDQTTDLYGITNWLWNFGDPVDPNDLSFSKDTLHTYSDTGVYCIKLIDINKHGCVDSITHCIVIDALFTFYIPDAFTPNADGVNDVFGPKGTYFTTFEMYIFDRWGQEIYFTNDITKGWKGSYYNGSTIAQQDTYIYVIKVNDFRGTQHSYTGKVTLLK